MERRGYVRGYLGSDVIGFGELLVIGIKKEERFR